MYILLSKIKTLMLIRIIEPFPLHAFERGAFAKAFVTSLEFGKTVNKRGENNVKFTDFQKK